MKDSFMFFLKGLLMGAADIVPGVSGGTIAFITGIYERLITGLKNITRWKIDWQFFLPLGVGVVLAFAAGSHSIPFLIEQYPSAVYSFFVGLILASAYIVYTHIKTHTIHGVFFGIAGVLLGIGVSLLPVQETTPSLILIFFLGMLAICAMLLPGVSGSYILVMFGQYTFMLHALKAFDLAYVVVFILGAGSGLLAFARVVSYLLRTYHDYTFFALTGIMLGALLRPVQIIVEHQQGVIVPTMLGLIGTGIVFLVNKNVNRNT